MPIVEIEIITRPGEAINKDLSRQLADLVGEVFASPPGGTWVKLNQLPIEHYAENGGGLSPDVFPVFVSVIKSKIPGQIELENEIALLTSAIARACGRPKENVHILYHANVAGRIAFGGKLLLDQ